MGRPWLWGMGAGLAATLGVLGYGLVAGDAGVVWPAVGALTAVLALGSVVAYRALWLARSSARACKLMGEAFSSTSQAWLITRPDGRVASASKAYTALAGAHSPEEAPSLRGLWAESPECATEIARLEAAAVSGSCARTDLRLQGSAPEGERWFDLAAEPVQGAPGHVLWRLDDVTERRAAEREAREKSTRVASILDDASVGFYAADAEGRLIHVNKSFAEALGRAPSELVAGRQSLRDFVEKELGATQAGLLEGPPTEGEAEVLLRGSDGTAWRALVCQKVFYGNDGSAQGTHAVVHDLEREARCLEALGQAERRFHGLFDHAPIGIALLDPEARVVDSNQAFRGMAGADAASAEGLPFVELLGTVDRDEVSAALGATARGESVAMPIDVRVTSPEERVLSLYITPVEEPGDAASRLVVHLIDASEQKKLELQFGQAQKMQAVGQLAGGIAHDFNNLLTAILGFCDLLLMRLEASDRSFSDIMQIKQNATRATTLVRQLLAFSRQQTLKPKVIDITDVLAELSNLLRRLIGENIQFNLVHERDLWLVKVDQGPFEQVIINLAVNARDAMPQGGTLTIRTRNVGAAEWRGPGHEFLAEGEYVLIEVSDTGTGIAREHLDKVFEPFFTTKGVGAGTGLGLSTAYGIVKQFSGFIFVDSRPGEGTRFYIFLPRHVSSEEARAIPSPVAEAERPPPRDLTGKGTILLVEDEDAVRLFAARSLRDKGYTVIEADSGDSALELFASHGGPIDVVVTDVIMPRMDGRTLVQEIRGKNPSIKVIFMSGYAEESVRADLEGEVNFLAKPFSIRELATKVKEVMGS